MQTVIRFLLGVLIGMTLALAVVNIGHAASTDTINIVIPEPVVKLAPVEQKVVEIHMSAFNPAAFETKTKRNRKSEKLPLFSKSGTCSGEFIDSTGDILTAGHCVEGFDMWEIQTFDQRKYYATVVSTSATHDLALLHIDRRNTSFFELADSVVRGQTVFALGSPLGITDTLSTGIVARIDGDITLIDCSALPGNSGGPLFDKDQKLVGVINAGFIVMLGVTHLNQAQGVDAVYFFLQEALKKKNGK